MPNYSIILITYENLDFDDLDLAMKCFSQLGPLVKWLIHNGDVVTVLESRCEVVCLS